MVGWGIETCQDPKQTKRRGWGLGNLETCRGDLTKLLTTEWGSKNVCPVIRTRYSKCLRAEASLANINS